MKNQQPAQPTDWKTEELPKQHGKIPLNRLFSAKQMDQIMMGLVPSEMEDRWFICWANDTLMFHRSWTGSCIYVVRFAHEQGGLRMVEAMVNRDPSQYTVVDDNYDAKLIESLIETFLLH